MAIVLTDDAHYKAIANAIRANGPYPNITLKPEEMAQNITIVGNVRYRQGMDDGYTSGRQDGISEGIGQGVQIGKEQGRIEGKRAEYDAFWDAYQDSGNRTDYRYAFAGPTWKNLKPKYPICFGSAYDDANGTFLAFGSTYKSDSEWINLEDFAEVDFSQATAAISTFANSCFNTVTVDFNNIAQASSCFNYGRIKNLYIRLSEKCTTAYQMFSNMGYTENLIFTKDSVLNYNFDFRSITKLTHESLMSIIDALKDYSETSTTNTCSLGTVNLAKLTDAEKAIATQKGWTLV